MEYAYFPITLEQLGATVHYHDIVEGTFILDDVCITTCYLNHPACTGVSAGGRWGDPGLCRRSRAPCPPAA